ncbi:enhancer of mRNA decapping, partial [Ascosphaera acerosa]
MEHLTLKDYYPRDSASERSAARHHHHHHHQSSRGGAVAGLPPAAPYLSHSVKAAKSGVKSGVKSAHAHRTVAMASGGSASATRTSDYNRKGWRHTPLIEPAPDSPTLPTASPLAVAASSSSRAELPGPSKTRRGLLRRSLAPSDATTATAATAAPTSTHTTPTRPRARKQGRRHRLLEEDANGWATEDATDIQEMGEFDFASNLRKFDKSRVFDEIRSDDKVRKEDRLVAHNRRAGRPGTNGGRNLHYTENVLDMDDEEEDEVDDDEEAAGVDRRRQAEPATTTTDESSGEEVVQRLLQQQQQQQYDDEEGVSSGRGSRRPRSRASQATMTAAAARRGTITANANVASAVLASGILSRGSAGSVGASASPARAAGSGAASVATPTVAATAASTSLPTSRAPRDRDRGDRGRDRARGRGRGRGRDGEGSLWLTTTNRLCPRVSPLQMLELEQLAIGEVGLTEEILAENAGRGIAEAVVT